MLSPRLRRRYGLPPEGETGLDERHEWLLQHLDARNSLADMHALIPGIPGFRALAKEALPEPAAPVAPPQSVLGTPMVPYEDAVRKRYGIPPDGPTSINRMRVQQLVSIHRRFVERKDTHFAKKKEPGWLVGLNGIIMEQRFISAWTHDGFKQPGVRSVRGATPEEDSQKIDAVMELENGKTYSFQVKCGQKGSFGKHAERDVVLVKIALRQTPEEIRGIAIEAILRYEAFRNQRRTRH